MTAIDYNFDETYLKVAKEFHDAKPNVFTEEQIYKLYGNIKTIIEHDDWQKLKECVHHYKRTCAEHNLYVCFNSYGKALNKVNCDPIKTAQGGVLHDFLDYDWQNFYSDTEHLGFYIKANFFDQHAFQHPLNSLKHAVKCFPQIVDDKIADIILRHMWPLTITMPKYPESWLVSWADKRDSLEAFKNPYELPKYLGIKVKVKK